MSVLINASTSTGLVQTADTSGEIELQSNGTTALKVNTNEGIQILNCLGVGNATPSTSGAGITFPATQSASTDANTLDDYEEGTWTPVDGSGAGLTLTTNTTSTYTKCGNMVIAFASVNYPSTANGQQAAIGGLPFTTASSGFAGATPRFTDRSFMHFGAMNVNTTRADIYQLSGGAPTNANFSSGRTDLMFIYRTA